MVGRVLWQFVAVQTDTTITRKANASSWEARMWRGRWTFFYTVPWLGAIPPMWLWIRRRRKEYFALLLLRSSGLASTWDSFFSMNPSPLPSKNGSSIASKVGFSVTSPGLGRLGQGNLPMTPFCRRFVMSCRLLNDVITPKSPDGPRVRLRWGVCWGSAWNMRFVAFSRLFCAHSCSALSDVPVPTRD